MRNKKQHYVPQFYLKNFSNDGKNIYCYDKEEFKSYPQSIKNIAQSKYFYGKDLTLEDNLSYLEWYSSLCINKLIKTRDYRLFFCKKLKEIFADFITFQFFRTLEVRKTYEEAKKLNPNFLKGEDINSYLNDMLSSGVLFNFSDNIFLNKMGFINK